MPSYIPNLSTDNMSYYLIPVAWMVALSPRYYSIGAYMSATNGKKKYNARAPRDFPKQVMEDQSLDSKQKGRILRAEYAQANQFETLGFFAAAVTAGNAAGLDAASLNFYSLGYVAVRILYNFAFIFGDLLPYQARSLSYMTAIGFCATLFIKAGNRMRK
jgi:uncharacterized MAPEG superfamily protein